MSIIFKIIPDSTPNIFAFKNALFLFPFFLFGLGLYRFKNYLASKQMLYVYIIGAIIGVILQQIYFFIPNKIEFYENFRIDIIIGLLSSGLLMNIKWKSDLFMKVAKYAYTIYLFHGFGTAGGRIILKYIGIHSEFIIFIVGSVISVAIPIVIDQLLSKWKWTRVLFLGKSPELR